MFSVSLNAYTFLIPFKIWDAPTLFPPFKRHERVKNFTIVYRLYYRAHFLASSHWIWVILDVVFERVEISEWKFIPKSPWLRSHRFAPYNIDRFKRSFVLNFVNSVEKFIRQIASLWSSRRWDKRVEKVKHSRRKRLWNFWAQIFLCSTEKIHYEIVHGPFHVAGILRN